MTTSDHIMSTICTMSVRLTRVFHHSDMKDRNGHWLELLWIILGWCAAGVAPVAGSNQESRQFDEQK